MRTKTATLHFIGLLLTSAAISGCALGPAYRRPEAPMPKSYVSTDGWAPSSPADDQDKGTWWSIYNDPVLDGLERQVVLNNQNVAAAEAAFRQASALVDEDRAGLWPSLGLTLGATRSNGTGGASATTGKAATDRYDVAANGTWAIDIWGKTRRLIEQSQAQSEGAKATLANATLLAQATLAIDYFSLRALDEQETLLTKTVANYQRALSFTQNQYNAGIAARADILSAQSQLRTTQASLTDLQVQRGQLQHAIATLIGVPVDHLTIAPAALATVVPVVPAGMPSSLLERRPDIAVAERQVAAANAAVGVARASYFPSLTLSASDTASASKLSNLFAADSTVWALGASASEAVIDFGLRRAQGRAAKASYDAAVANYRGTVLAAFQGVEDQLLALRVLETEQGLREEAEGTSAQAEAIVTNQYRAGYVAYANVITAQNTTLSAKINTLAVRRSRLIASVTLIQNLGGRY